MSKFWVQPPPPATKFGRYRQLSPLAGVHVSPICLGAMMIGDKWAELGMGSMGKESSFKLLDAYYKAGGNFIDTANAYQDETSEMFIGEWMEARGIRDQLVIATKVSCAFWNFTRCFWSFLPSIRRTTNAARQASSRRHITSATI